MKILIVSVTFPYPPTRSGTEVRTFNFIKYFSRNHAVTVVAQRSPDTSDDDIEALRQQLSHLEVFSPPPANNNGRVGKIARMGNFILEGTPPSVRSHYSQKMQNWIDSGVENGTYDAILCEHSANEPYVRQQWRQQNFTTAVDIHSSVYGTCKHQLQTHTSSHPLRDRLYLPLLHRYEQRYCRKFSHIVVTTEDDRRQISQLYPQANLAVIPNGVDLDVFPYRQQDPGGYRLIFAGVMDVLPNIDAVCFFAREVFPHIRDKYPQAEFYIVGGKPTPDVLQLQEQPGVVVTGRVDAMCEQLHQATVGVIPMRTGFGIKNKTLEAMAAGVPVVGSDRGLEGLQVDTPTQRALRANRPQEYVSAIAQLFDSPQLRAELSQNGRHYIASEYSWEKAGQQYEAFLFGK